MMIGRSVQKLSSEFPRAGIKGPWKHVEKLLLVNGTIVEPGQGQFKNDILIVNGRIEKIGGVDRTSFAGEIVDLTGRLVVPGLLDMHAHFREPGREDEETIETGCQAAMAGGFTGVCVMPNTDPPVDDAEVVRFILDRAAGQLVDVYPIAAVTKGRRGKELTEMAELVEAGAVAFSDDGSPVVDSEIMRRALEYTSMLGVPVIDHCEDLSLSRNGVMNESFVSTELGLPGIPNISEEVVVARDLLLAKYTGGRVHIAHLSTAGSVELLRRAKNDGLKVTCEVTPHHFSLTDEAVRSYDANYKMNPPLRTAADVEAIKAALKDGTIDVIATDHAPHSIEEKEVEFSAAPFGIIGLETVLGLVFTQLIDTGVLTLPEAIEKMSVAPARILGCGQRRISPGQPANLTIIDPNARWVVDKMQFKSKSRNSPFHGWTLRGRVFGLVNKSLWWATETGP